MEGRQSKIGSDYITCAWRLTSHIWRFACRSQELLQHGRQREASIENVIDRCTQKIQHTTNLWSLVERGDMERCTTPVRSRLISIITLERSSERTAWSMSLS